MLIELRPSSREDAKLGSTKPLFEVSPYGKGKFGYEPIRVYHIKSQAYPFSHPMASDGLEHDGALCFGLSHLLKQCANTALGSMLLRYPGDMTSTAYGKALDYFLTKTPVTKVSMNAHANHLVTKTNRVEKTHETDDWPDAFGEIITGLEKIVKLIENEIGSTGVTPLAAVIDRDYCTYNRAEIFSHTQALRTAVYEGLKDYPDIAHGEFNDIYKTITEHHL